MILAQSSLMSELGCGNCHSGLEPSKIVKKRAPDLSYSGIKYNEAFSFINNKKYKDFDHYRLEDNTIYTYKGPKIKSKA